MKPSDKMQDVLNDKSKKKILSQAEIKKYLEFEQFVNEGNIPAVIKAIDSGLNPNLYVTTDQNNVNNSYLLQAVTNNNLEMVKCLSERGGDACLNHTDNLNPYLIAIIEGHISIVRYFLTRFKHLSHYTNDWKVTPLHMIGAARISAPERIKMSKLLLEFGVFINQPDHQGMLPLTRKDLQAKSNDPEAMDRLKGKLIISKAIDLMDFSKKNHSGKFSGLKTLGAGVNGRDVLTGYTALHYAVSNGNKELIQDLIAAKANPVIRGIDEQSVFRLAEKHKDPFIRILFQCINFEIILEQEQASKDISQNTVESKQDRDYPKEEVSTLILFESIHAKLSEIKDKSEREIIRGRLTKVVDSCSLVNNHLSYRTALELDFVRHSPLPESALELREALCRSEKKTKLNNTMHQFSQCLQKEDSIRSSICESLIIERLRIDNKSVKDDLTLSNDSLKLDSDDLLKRADKLSEISLNLFEEITIELLKLPEGEYGFHRETFFTSILPCTFIKHYQLFFSKIKELYANDLLKSPKLREPKFDDSFLSFFMEQVDKGPYARCLGKILNEPNMEPNDRLAQCRMIIKEALTNQPGFNLNMGIVLSSTGQHFLTHNPLPKIVHPNGAKQDVGSSGLIGHALLRAVYQNEVQLINLFIEFGASVNHSTEKVGSPLKLAVSYGHLESVKILLNHKIKITNEHVIAAQNNFTEIVECLILAGANVNECLSTEDKSDALDFAVKNKNLKLVKLLVEDFKENLDSCVAPANLFHVIAHEWAEEQESIKGQPNLSEDQLAIIRCLHNAGVDPNYVGVNGRTPIMQAIIENNVSVFEALLDLNNINVNAQGEYGDTALSLAAEQDHSYFLKALLKKNPVINHVNADGDTALFAAVNNPNNVRVEMVEILLKAGAHSNITNREGRSPLSYALEKTSIDSEDVRDLLIHEWKSFFCNQRESGISHEGLKAGEQSLEVFLRCFSNILLDGFLRKKIVFNFNSKTSCHEITCSNINLFKRCPDFYDVNAAAFNKKVIFSNFPKVLLSVYKRVRLDKNIRNDLLLQALWEEVPAKQVFDKRKKFKDNADYNRKTEPLIDALLIMPKTIASIKCEEILNKIKESKMKVEGLLETNNKINQKPAVKPTKEKARHRRKEENQKTLESMAKLIKKAMNIFDVLDAKLKLFNKLFSRKRKKILDLIDNGKLEQASKRVQLLKDLLEKEPKEFNDAKESTNLERKEVKEEYELNDIYNNLGISILARELTDVYQEFDKLCEICKSRNEEDSRIDRREQTPAEQTLVESKQKEEENRLARDKKQGDEQTKAIDLKINRAKVSEQQKQDRIRAWEISEKNQKKGTKSSDKHRKETTQDRESPESGNSPERNNHSPENLEVKGTVEANTLSDAGTDFKIHSQSHPSKRTFASLTELPKKLEVLDEVSQIKFILENPPTLDNEHTRKLESYALLLACAKAMHTIKGIKGEAVFPRPMAEKFRNTIYHAYNLFQALASKKDLKLTIPETDSDPAETIHILAVDMNTKVREMAVNLYQYIRSKITDDKEKKQTQELKQTKDLNQAQETKQELDSCQELLLSNQMRELKQAKDQILLDPQTKLKIETKEIIGAINSPLFNAILKVKIPAKTENTCIEVMKESYQELQALRSLKRNSIHPFILKAAEDLIVARIGSFYAYGYDHFANITNDKQFKPYRQFRAQGNITRHNEKAKQNCSKQKFRSSLSFSSAGSSAGNDALVPLRLQRENSTEFPKLSEPKSQRFNSNNDHSRGQSSIQNCNGLAASLTASNSPNKKGELVIFSQASHNHGYHSEQSRQNFSATSRSKLSEDFMQAELMSLDVMVSDQVLFELCGDTCQAPKSNTQARSSVCEELARSLQREQAEFRLASDLSSFISEGSPVLSAFDAIRHSSPGFDCKYPPKKEDKAKEDKAKQDKIKETKKTSPKKEGKKD